MRRLMAASAAVSMFCFASMAGAEEKGALSLQALLKTDTSTGAELSFVFVQGQSLYADGTKIFVGIQAPDSTRYLKVVHAIVEKGRFLAEIGPWEQHFPPGRYHVVAEFRYEDQSPALQQILDSSRDLETCMKDNKAYRERYYRENPERAKLFDDYIARTGRCPGKTGFGEATLAVGSEQDIDRAAETELALLRGHADAVELLAGQVVGLDGEESLAAWRAELEATAAAVRKEHSSVVCCRHPEAWELIDNAIMNLGWCADDTQALVTGPGAALRASLAELEKKGDAADKDDRRRLTKDRTALAALEDTRSGHARTAITALASALFGPQGLEPAPARARKLEADLLEKCGVKPEEK